MTKDPLPERKGHVQRLQVAELSLNKSKGNDQVSSKDIHQNACTV